VSPSNWKIRIADIHESLDRIQRYVDGLDYESWKNDEKTIDAIPTPTR
jgi:uncharacterized protein with HEPN domain